MLVWVNYVAIRGRRGGATPILPVYKVGQGYHFNDNIVSLYLDSSGVVFGTSGIADYQNVSIAEYLTTFFPCTLPYGMSTKTLRRGRMRTCNSGTSESL